MALPSASSPACRQADRLRCALRGTATGRTDHPEPRCARQRHRRGHEAVCGTGSLRPAGNRQASRVRESRKLTGGCRCRGTRDASAYRHCATACLLNPLPAGKAKPREGTKGEPLSSLKSIRTSQEYPDVVTLVSVLRSGSGPGSQTLFCPELNLPLCGEAPCPPAHSSVFPAADAAIQLPPIALRPGDILAPGIAISQRSTVTFGTLRTRPPLEPVALV